MRISCFFSSKHCNWIADRFWIGIGYKSKGLGFSISNTKDNGGFTKKGDWILRFYLIFWQVIIDFENEERKR